MSKQSEVIPMELKYCEACGALWLRPRNSQATYCRRCEKVMAELSRPQGMNAAEGRPS